MTLATLIDRLIYRARCKAPDLVVGSSKRPYMHRWWLIPRNPVFNVYLHHFLRSDDDRALHDHPWPSLSILLRGSYLEHTIQEGGIHHRRVRRAGAIVLRGPRSAHRIELHHGACWTLFLTGPRLRNWGFHLPLRGWVPHDVFMREGQANND